MYPVLSRDLERFFDEPTDLIRRELSRMFRGWPEPVETGNALTGTYPVDINEDENSVYVEAEMPGFSKDDISVTLEQGVLNISAERKPEDFEGTKHLQERLYTQVQRRFTLPAAVDESTVEAGFKDGVLTLKIQKTPEAKPRRIKIS